MWPSCAASGTHTLRTRRRAFATHPDRAGGDAAAFHAVFDAYRSLSDPALHRAQEPWPASEPDTSTPRKAAYNTRVEMARRTEKALQRRVRDLNAEITAYNDRVRSGR